MKLIRFQTIFLLLAATLFFPPAASANSLNEQLIGSWSLVFLRATAPDGKITEPYGANGKGTLMFDRNGRFSLIILDGSLPKYASNNRGTPTPDEAMAVAKGSFAFFGTYTVDEATNSFVFEIEASNFPNFNGAKQKRIVKAISASELRFINETSPGSAVVTELSYRRY